MEVEKCWFLESMSFTKAKEFQEVKGTRSFKTFQRHEVEKISK